MDIFLDWLQPGITLLMFALMLVYTRRRWRAKALARRAAPVQAKVVAVERREGGRMYRCHVVTTFEVPGHGALRHVRGCETDGKALLWSRLHKEGSVHWVVPDEVHPGEAFLRGDLERTDWPSLAMVAIIGALALYSIYLMALEYRAYD